MSYRLDQAVCELHSLARDIEAEVDARHDESSKFLQAAVSALKRRLETDPAFAKSAAEPRKAAKTLPDSLDKLVPGFNSKLFAGLSQNLNPNDDAKLPTIIVPSVAPPLPPKIPASEEPSGSTDSYSPDHDFQSMKFNELKKLAKLKGIPIERETKKEQLVYRLREFFKKEYENQQLNAGLKPDGTLRSETRKQIAAQQALEASKTSAGNVSALEDKKSEISSIVEIASQSMEDANEDDLQKRARELEEMAVMAKKAKDDIMREIQRKKDEAEKARLERERLQKLKEEQLQREKEEAERLAREAAEQAKAEEAERIRKEQEHLAQQAKIREEEERRRREQEEEEERKRKAKEEEERREAAAKAAKQKELEDERKRLEDELNKKLEQQLQKAGIDSNQTFSASDATTKLKIILDSRGKAVHNSGDKNTQPSTATNVHPPPPSSSSSSSAGGAPAAPAQAGPGAMLPSKLFSTPKFHIKGGGGGGNSSPAGTRTIPPHMVSLLNGGNAGPSGYGVSPSTEPVVFRPPQPPQQQPQYYPASGAGGGNKIKPASQQQQQQDYSSQDHHQASPSPGKEKEYPLPEDTEFSGSDEDTDDGKIPSWAKGPELLRALKEQYEGRRDPHTIFPPMGVSEFPIEEIFRKRGNIRPRGSSAIWTRDGVTSEERLRYQEGSKHL